MSCSGTLRHTKGGIEPAALRLPDDCSYLLSHIAPININERRERRERGKEGERDEREERKRESYGRSKQVTIQVLVQADTYSMCVQSALFQRTKHSTEQLNLRLKHGFSRVNIEKT